MRVSEVGWRYQLSIPVLGLILQVLFMLSISVFNFIRIFVMEQFNVYP